MLGVPARLSRSLLSDSSSQVGLSNPTHTICPSEVFPVTDKPAHALNIFYSCHTMEIFLTSQNYSDSSQKSGEPMVFVSQLEISPLPSCLSLENDCNKMPLNTDSCTDKRVYLETMKHSSLCSGY